MDSWFDVVKSICISVKPLLDTILESCLNATIKQMQLMSKLYSNLYDWKILAFLYFLYDILGYLMELNKVFQKGFIKFSDIEPIIKATISRIQKEYLNDGGPELGNKLNEFLSSAPPGSNIHIGKYQLTWDTNYENDLMADIY